MSRIQERALQAPASKTPDRADAGRNPSREGTFVQGNRRIKVEYIDRAVRTDAEAGLNGYRLLDRQYNVAWDDGRPVPLEDRKVAQALVDKVRPRTEMIRNMRAQNDSHAGEALSAKGDFYVNPGDLKVARAVYDKKGTDAFANIPPPLPLAHNAARESQPARLPTLADEIEGLDDTSFRRAVAERAKLTSLSRDLGQVFDYMGSARGDLDHLNALSQKLQTGEGLSAKETATFSNLLHAYKENLPLLQRFLAEGPFAATEPNTSNRALVEAVMTRVADTHMAVADLFALHSEHISDTPPLARADRIGFHRLQAEGMRNALTALRAAHPDNAPLHAQCAQAEVEINAHIKSLDENHLAGPQATHDLKAALDMPLGKSANLTPKMRRTLAQTWDSAMAQGKPALALAHPDIPPQQVLDLFVRHMLQKGGVDAAQFSEFGFLQKEGVNKAINERAWPKTDNAVRMSMNDKTADFRSVIEPAALVSDKLETPYAGHGVGSADRTQYAHAVNLARTQLYDHDGALLFSAHRAGVMDSYNLTPKTMSKMSDARLESMFQTLLVDTGHRPESAQQLVHLFRSSSSHARSIAAAARAEAAEKMGQDLAATMLVNNADKYERALKGEIVDLPISSLSLMTPDVLRSFGRPDSNERMMLAHHQRALNALANNGEPLTLNIRDKQGGLSRVRVRVRPRIFSFGVNAGALRSFGKASSNREPFWRALMGWGFSAKLNDPALEGLLGHRSSSYLGGDVQENLSALRARAEEIARARSAPGISPGEDKKLRGEFTRNLERQAVISQLADQVKQMWRDRSYMQQGREPYKLVSRLQLLNHYMGEESVFHCKSGKDRTGQLDNEVKYLAAHINMYGNVPPLNQQPNPESRRARTAFALGCGSHEMQRMNTGLPGYKVNGIPELDKLFESHALPVYRGGSSFVSG